MALDAPLLIAPAEVASGAGGYDSISHVRRSVFHSPLFALPASRGMGDSAYEDASRAAERAAAAWRAAAEELRGKTWGGRARRAVNRVRHVSGSWHHAERAAADAACEAAEDAAAAWLHAATAWHAAATRDGSFVADEAAATAAWAFLAQAYLPAARETGDMAGALTAAELRAAAAREGQSLVHEAWIALNKSAAARKAAESAWDAVGEYERCSS